MPFSGSSQPLVVLPASRRQPHKSIRSAGHAWNVSHETLSVLRAEPPPGGKLLPQPVTLRSSRNQVQHRVTALPVHAPCAGAPTASPARRKFSRIARVGTSRRRILTGQGACSLDATPLQHRENVCTGTMGESVKNSDSEQTLTMPHRALARLNCNTENRCNSLNTMTLTSF